MTRVQFLNDLYHHLYGMTREQAEQHLTYYAEMLADRMEEGMSEEDAVASMEDVETIARRIMEEEGLPYTPPDQRPVAPPAYPDASKLGGGGGTRAYQAPKQRNWKKYAQIALWIVAIIVVIDAVSSWWWNHSGARPMPDTVTESAAIDSSSEAPLAEDWGYEAPFEQGYEYLEEDGEALGVDAIDIEWASGMVCIQTWSGDGVQIREYAQSELTERTRRQVELINGEMVIRYREGFGLGNAKGSKWLTVLVPEGFMGEIDIETTSANVQINGVELDTLRVSTASGDISIWECYTQTTELSTISGYISAVTLYADQTDISSTSGYISGEVYSDEIDVSSISGDINLGAPEVTSLGLSTTSGDVSAYVNDTAIREITASSVSGPLTIGLPADTGYTLDLTNVSGDFSVPFDTKNANGEYIYNGGGCEISVDTVSGNLDIYFY